ncbi:type II toxin-antitoxin system MqsR family toxin [Pseudomonas soli]|uniref:type II toxin-antitoxin system MqsR family toxin n=1 Tax=Pseudomonas soli TaxID=1306993 RepID=UPI00382831B7
MRSGKASRRVVAQLRRGATTPHESKKRRELWSLFVKHHTRHIFDAVRGLSSSDFYKSMTTYHDHRHWQDVYHVHTPFGWVYLKLAVMDDVLVVSFKEL